MADTIENNKLIGGLGGPDKIKNALRHGVAKPNLFVVSMFGPHLRINGEDPSYTKTVTENGQVTEQEKPLPRPQIALEGVRCITAELPARAITTVDHSHYGVLRKYPTAVDYSGGSTSMSFLVDNTFEDLTLIRLWQELIYNNFELPTTISETATDFLTFKTAKTTYVDRSVELSGAKLAPVFNFRNEYMGTISIATVDRQGNATSIVELCEAFPTNIQSVALDSTNVDTPLVITIDFAFTYYRRTETNIGLRDKNGKGFESLLGEMRSNQPAPTQTTLSAEPAPVGYTGSTLTPDTVPADINADGDKPPTVNFTPLSPEEPVTINAAGDFPPNVNYGSGSGYLGRFNDDLSRILSVLPGARSSLGRLDELAAKVKIAEARNKSIFG